MTGGYLPSEFKFWLAFEVEPVGSALTGVFSEDVDRGRKEDKEQEA